MAANVYIDAFNLYYGCLKDGPHRWLDLGALCERLLPRDEVHRTRYFTAPVRDRGGNVGQAFRQQTYLRALRTDPGIAIHFGHYLSHPVRMRLANPPKHGPRYAEVIKTEEKGSDVNLASHLLLDAFRRDCEVAIVISNDSDLKEPVHLVTAELGVPVGVINPHPVRRRSKALESTFFKQLRRSALRSSQFPASLRDADGPFHKPPAW